MAICFHPIGRVRTDVPDEAIPHHYTVSEVEGILEIQPEYEAGLTDIHAGQRIVVLFHFDRSPTFSREALQQVPRLRKETRGIFSICSPIRPNPIGLSVLEVIKVENCTIHVKGIDMFDGTPILDIKPEAKQQAKSNP